MLEICVILAFTVVLLFCVAAGVSMVLALGIGYGIFFLYSLKKGFSPRDVFDMSMEGLKTVKNILMIFMLIGMITALWRAAGTIPVIICYSARLIRPSIFVLLAFLLNCMVSVLTGTSLGTAATMGVICMTMGRAMNVNPLFMGGAIISGIFFGDRCSPVSSSALLVAELTKTDIYGNIKNMIKTSVVPFLFCCVFYGILGTFSNAGGEMMDVEALFAGSFNINPAAVIPAALILILSLFRMKVKRTMIASIAASAAVCLFLQDMSLMELGKNILFGYEASDEVLASMLNGGGVLSMIRVSVIVGLSSCYAGIFERTGLLSGMKEYVAVLGEKISPFGAIIVVSIVTSIVSCNQTLASILTHQLCDKLEADKERMAVHLENTVILMAPLVPWSVAGSVPVAAIGVSSAVLFLAVYLYVVPLWNYFVELRVWKKEKR